MIFLKYCILPNLNKANTDQRKVKFQKHISCFLSTLEQILIM